MKYSDLSQSELMSLLRYWSGMEPSSFAAQRVLEIATALEATFKPEGKL